MEFRKMVLISYLQGRNRDRHREQTCGHSGGRRGWDELSEKHGNIYTTMYKIDSQWGIRCMIQGAQVRCLMTS